MGSPDVRAFSCNKRRCVGPLIWINFERHALLERLDQTAIFNSSLPREVV